MVCSPFNGAADDDDTGEVALVVGTAGADATEEISLDDEEETAHPPGGASLPLVPEVLNEDFAYDFGLPLLLLLLLEEGTLLLAPFITPLDVSANGFKLLLPSPPPTGAAGDDDIVPDDFLYDPLAKLFCFTGLSLPPPFMMELLAEYDGVGTALTGPFVTLLLSEDDDGDDEDNEVEALEDVAAVDDDGDDDVPLSIAD